MRLYTWLTKRNYYKIIIRAISSCQLGTVKQRRYDNNLHYVRNPIKHIFRFYVRSMSWTLRWNFSEQKGDPVNYLFNTYLLRTNERERKNKVI